MKKGKRILSLVVCLALVFSFFSVTALACEACKSDSRALGISRTGIIVNATSGVKLRSCHNTTSSAGALALNGDAGAVTHIYPATGTGSWVRIEISSGNAKGNNGWVGTYYVNMPEI